MSLRDQLVRAIAGWNLQLPADFDDDTSLLRSGVLDSLALFNLVLWVEDRLGAPVDPTSFDLVEQWDTVTHIVRFVETRRAS